MADRNYWQGLANSRLNRRRMLAITGGAAASAALLAACGGSDNGGGSGGSGSSGSSSAKNGQFTDPVETSSQARAGGALKYYATSDTTDFDSLSSNTAKVVGNGNPAATGSDGFQFNGLT